jgi:hypothetical protein
MNMFRIYTAMVFGCGGLFGFYAGVISGPPLDAYFESRQRETLALVDAPTVQPMSGEWRLVRRDGIGDNPSGKAFLLVLSDVRGLGAKLQVVCDPFLSVEIYSDDLRPQPEGYAATYRMQVRRRAQSAHWRSVAKTAVVGDLGEFLPDLERSDTLSVALTPVAAGLGASTTRFDFDTRGYSESLDHFRRHCDVIPRPHPDPGAG